MMKSPNCLDVRPIWVRYQQNRLHRWPLDGVSRLDPIYKIMEPILSMTCNGQIKVDKICFPKLSTSCRSVWLLHKTYFEKKALAPTSALI